MENPIKMDDLGGTPIFGNTHIFQYWLKYRPPNIGPIWSLHNFGEQRWAKAPLLTSIMGPRVHLLET